MSIINRIKKNDAVGIGMKIVIGVFLFFIIAVVYFYFFPSKPDPSGNVKKDTTTNNGVAPKKQKLNIISQKASDVADYLRGEDPNAKKLAQAQIHQKTFFDNWYFVTWIKEVRWIKWISDWLPNIVNYAFDWLFFIVYVAVAAGIPAAIGYYFIWPYVRQQDVSVNENAV